MGRVLLARRLVQSSNGSIRWPFHVSTDAAKNYQFPPVVCDSIYTETAGIFYGENPFNYTFSSVLIQFFLIVLAIHIVRLLLKPLKQPRIVCEIIGGIIVGSSFLRRNNAFYNMFSETAQFVVKNIGIVGFMFFLFVSGVKMDAGFVRKPAKKHVYIALIGIVIPTMAVITVAIIMRKKLDSNLRTISSLGGIASYLGITAFPVLYNILKELNLLSSDVGRTALSTAMVGDAMGSITIIAFEAGKQGETGAIRALWFLISLVLLVAFILICLGKLMRWIVERTPQGAQADQSYVVGILLGVLVMGFVTDMLGIAIANGSLWLGLIIPDGPPLGSTMVEKTETITMEFLMPFSFLMVGFYTDVSAMREFGWSNLSPLFAMVLTGYLTKLLSTWIATIIWKMPMKEGLAFSLIMSLRGQIELILFVHWMDKKMIGNPGFTLLVLMTAAMTAILTPLICILYDPTRPYMLNERRTIQHSQPDKELNIVLSILDQQRISGIIDLLEASSPTITSPFNIKALHLVELVGSASPVFIDHEQQEVPPKYEFPRTINSLKHFQELKGTDFIKLHLFTSISPRRTMYQDICELALEHKATLIILPFPKKAIYNIEGTRITEVRPRIMHSNVIAHAPCSVAILVDKGIINLEANNTGHSYRFVVLFLGGPDAREALVYADRMVGNVEVNLTVIRFLTHNCEGGSEKERKIDDEVVTWFWVKNELNGRVVYREVVVGSGEETIAAIQAMNDGSYDLWIVGRKQGINPNIISGLRGWSETQELGPIGDYISFVDFSGSALVIHQQITRG
ncbi:hypothetical protein L6164_028759 [Bauhinia variegata]|uniref:Uncharacterized protein n=1 Tax=Bauhinia variegata TaxID=167791 RepID=A0ACB9L6T2_BAUVA|nr:hypothetical protein L6164_028759 [Bauhinia variegata]